MKAILLAGGYAKRLNELCKNTPKALLDVNGKPVINYLIDKMEKINDFKEVYVVTNDTFLDDFNNWAAQYKGNLNIIVCSDGSTCEENKKGAIGAILHVIEKYNLNDDCFVSATDSYFKNELYDFIEQFNKNDFDYVMAQKLENKEELKRFGVVELNENNIIIGMEEKPQNPKSDIVVYATYLYKKDTLPLFELYKRENQNMDAPGNFIKWLYQRNNVKAYIVNKEYIDIGTIQSYNYANRK